MLRELSLTWFRGAAETVALRTKGKSVGVYGPNGAGKTSFVDGFEFLVTGGRISHLAHEYSGRRQENAILNTHAPDGSRATVRMVLDGDVEVTGSLGKQKAADFRNREALAGWSLDRMVLRQNQVAEFIQAEKSDKYSTLLPIIGLGRLEVAANDLNALTREAERESGLAANNARLDILGNQWARAFPGMNLAEVGTRIKASHRHYFPDGPGAEDLTHALADLKRVVGDRLGKLETEQRVQALLRQAQESGVPVQLAEAIEASAAASARAEPLLAERLTILRAALAFGEKLPAEGSLNCPACGQDIEAEAFQAHVRGEESRLSEALLLYANFRIVRSKLASCLHSMQGAMNSSALGDWRAGASVRKGGPELETVLSVNPEELRSENPGAALAALSAAMPAAQALLDHEAATVAPELDRLLRDRNEVDAAGGHREIRLMRKAVERAENLLSFIRAAETGIRAEIRERSATVLGSISADVARMWGILHPGEAIDAIQLYQNDIAERAIDISVCFHGKQQPSPRLTLSEGHRNSLGLCVFLALALKDSGLPLVLDDVVTSFDREHRANVVDLLLAEFPARQVILFTHDYEWFLELRQRLPSARWSFAALQPQSDPTTGIRWSGNPPGFEAARAILAIDAGSAANKARSLMDLHLAMVCERLSVPLPFMRGARNDMRNAGELLERLRGRASEKFRRLNADGSAVRFEEFQAATADLNGLLVTWANSGSHGREVTRGEAERIIATCERVLSMLGCASCKAFVWAEKVEGKQLKCACGQLLWIV
jgi:energy-coupling factor transporter ATP-binding protein EcfA2